MEYNFDEIIQREKTASLKWDRRDKYFGRKDILPMWVADMDFKSPPEVTEAIKKRADHGIYGYTFPSEDIFESVTQWFSKRHGWEIEKKHLVSSPGVISSLNTAIQAFTLPGDSILIQTPVYYPFYSCIEGNSRVIVKNPLTFSGEDCKMDFSDLEKKLSAGVKLMILCSPHNPLGRVWEKSELEKVRNLCHRYRVLLVSDEIHCDLVYKGYRHIPAPVLSADTNKNTITLVSPTKTFNMAGLCQSFAVIPDNLMRKRFLRQMNINGSGMVNIFGLEASRAAYSLGENWLDSLMTYLESNLDILTGYFKENMPGIKVIRPRATYLAWLDCRGLDIPHENLKEFFTRNAGVGLNDGASFGEEGRGYMRLNFACPEKLLITALKKIENSLKI